MKNPIVFLGLCALVSLASCGQPEPEIDPQKEADNLIATSREWARAAQTGDTDSILSYWSEDAVLIMPQGPAVEGQAALREVLKGAEGVPGFEVNWEPKEAYVSESGDLGYIIAHKYFKMPDSTGQPFTTFHREVTIWKKQADGSWKNVVDIYNSDPTLTSID